MSRAAYINGLTAEENERLAVLSEECAEVIQIIGKIQRHGYESTNPDSITGVTNRMLLQQELGDVDAAVTLMVKKNDVTVSVIMAASRNKLKRLVRWLRLKANINAVLELLA